MDSLLTTSLPAPVNQLRWLLLTSRPALEFFDSYYTGLLYALFVLFLGLSVAPLVASRAVFRHANVLQSRTLFVAVLLTFIGFGRLPCLLPGQLNPDEGLFTAAAAKLMHDPVFWRSVDTGSSGPISIFPLTWPAAFNLFPDYASSRLAGLAMVMAAAALLYGSVRVLYSEVVARVAVVPFAATMAVMTYWDFVHYSSEHMPLFLISVTLLMVCIYVKRARQAGAAVAALAGLLIGSMPYAKMQAVPLALALAAIFLHAALQRSRNDLRGAMKDVTCFVAGALTCTLVTAVYLNAYGLQNYFWQSYIETNLFHYAGLKPLSTLDKVRTTLAMLRHAKDLHLLVGVAAVAVCITVPTFLFRRESRPIIAYAYVLLCAALYAVARPGNFFEHYLLLLAVPLGFLVALAFGELVFGAMAADAAGARSKALFAGAFGLLIVLTAGARVVIGPENPYLLHAGIFVERYRGPIAKAILKHAVPGSLIEVWGWSPSLYVDTGMIQGTRFGCTVWQIEPGPLRENFQRVYIEDLQRAKPVLFIDAIASGMFYAVDPQRSVHGHDALRRIAAAVAESYELVEEIDGVRLYRAQTSAASLNPLLLGFETDRYGITHPQ